MLICASKGFRNQKFPCVAERINFIISTVLFAKESLVKSLDANIFSRLSHRCDALATLCLPPCVLRKNPLISTEGGELQGKHGDL